MVPHKLLPNTAAMPGVIEGGEGAAKRKRLESKHKPSKRARSESSEEDVQTHILLLENQIFESKKNYNNISTLIKLLRSEDEDLDTSIAASVALCRIFTRLMAAGDLAKQEGTAGKDLVVTLWLQQRYAEYKTALLQLLNRRASGSTALTLCMRILKSEGTHLLNGQEYHFPIMLLRDILKILLRSETGNTLHREFSEKYVEEYDDVRFYTFAAIE
jgi:U3 small nucleolar RNA-associated protein 19